jgi:membrane peptidoglycan carboxypeptidase
MNISMKKASNMCTQSPKKRIWTLLMPYWLNAIVEGSQILGIGEKELMKGGYKIYTYFDKSVQNILYNAFCPGNTSA